MVAKRSATGERTQTINQARAPILTGPDDLRARFTGHAVAALVAELASLRPRPGSTVGYATRIALRELGRRAEFLDSQIGLLNEFIGPLLAARAPGLLALYGIGPHTAALLLIAAGITRNGCTARRPGRTCAALPPSRHPRARPSAAARPWRRPPGQPCPVADRVHPPGIPPATRAYAERRTAEGKSKKEIISCLKRYVAREVYPHLRATTG